MLGWVRVEQGWAKLEKGRVGWRLGWVGGVTHCTWNVVGQGG